MGGDSFRQEYWIRHHPYERLTAEPSATVRIDADDARMVERVVGAYRRTMEREFYGADSMWRVFRSERQRELHELMAHGPLEDIAEALRSPKDNTLLLGFENINRDACARYRVDNDAGRDRAGRLHDLVACLAEALGALRVENPEGGPWLENVARPADELLDLVEARLGIALAVPWFWAGLVGLHTRRGVFNHRMIHAAYVAHRVRQLVEDVPQPRILEIGAGLGHLARYAWLMGLRDYTIVDLPLTNVAQGYFLMRCLGENAVVLEGEPVPAGRRAIRVLTPTHLEAGGLHYDLAVNVDSMTEVGREVASRYLDRIFAFCETLLSLNHEANPFTVHELLRARGDALRVERFPCWTRRGYVEEIVRRR